MVFRYRFDWLEWDRRTIEKMIVLYCSKNHTGRILKSFYGNKPICPDCKNLLDYALTRIEKCPYGNDKPNCASCTTHCYKPVMRKYVRKSMRYSGPRVIFYHPLTALIYIYRKKNKVIKKLLF